MASRAVSLWRRTRGETARPGPEPRGPRARPAFPALAEVAASPAEALGRPNCLSILVELLRPFGAGASVWAADLLDEFGSVAAVLAASQAAQERVLGPGNPAIPHLGMVRSVMLHVLCKDAVEGPILASSEALLDYLYVDMAHLPAERLRVLFLNSKNRLLRDEVMGEGSVSETPVYPREIMRRALEIGATALILVHNHPSGDPEPSRGDIEATRRIIEAGRPFEIRIHDHVIIARSGWSSFRTLGLI